MPRLSKGLSFRARLSWPVLALGCLTTAACSYIFDVPTASVSSSLVDGGAGDGDTPPLDADLYADPDASLLRPPPPFCATKYPFLFCADFDGVVGPALEDLGTVETRQGALRVAEILGLSPTRSLLATADGNDTSALFVPTLTETSPVLTASASLLVSTFTSTEADLMAIEFTPNVDEGGATRCFARLTATTHWAVTQVCTDGGVETARVVKNSGQPIERRRWQTFTLSVTELGTITLAIDGLVVVNVTMVAPMAPSPSPQRASFGVEHSANGSIAIFYDDLLVTGATP